MNSISGSANKTEIDVKRFYVPGIVINTKCYNCDEPYKLDLSDDYLSFPVTGKSIPVTFYCDKDACNSTWDVNVVLDLTVRLG